MTKLNQYCVVGKLDSGKKQSGNEILIMKIFAPNEIIGKSRFWYFLKKAQKIKKSNGKLIVIKKIYEKKNNGVKNFGIWIKYESKGSVTNMYKEYRDVLASRAVGQMYLEMAGRYHAKWSSIVILRIEEIAGKDCIRPYIKQFQGGKIKFPIIRRLFRDTNNINSDFKALRPKVTVKS